MGIKRGGNSSRLGSLCAITGGVGKEKGCAPAIKITRKVKKLKGKEITADPADASYLKVDDFRQVDLAFLEINDLDDRLPVSRITWLLNYHMQGEFL